MEAVRSRIRSLAAATAGTTPTAGSGTRASGYPSFAGLLGPSAWARLPAAVRERFPAVHSADEQVRYAGTMRYVNATAFGRLLAWCAQIFDTPVATRTGENVQTIVKVYPQPKLKGIVWERIYHFPGRAPVTVRSTKCLDREGRLIEALGGGLRMVLTLTEENGTLRFTSTGYSLEVLGISVRLPRWFPPGITHVIHTDEGGGRFRFTMYTEHPWFGQMFFQEGSFSEEETAAERVAKSATGLAAEEAE